MDKMELSGKFEDFKQRLIGDCGIDRYETVFTGTHFMLDGYFEDIYKDIGAILVEVKQSNKLVTRDFISFISNQLNIYLNSNSKYSKKCANQLQRIYRLLTGHVDYLENVPEVENATTTVITFKFPKQSEYNKPELNSKQLLALMKILRENKVFNKDLTTVALTDGFGNLTGYSGAQFKRDYNNNDVFTEAEIGKLKDILVNIGKAIDKLPVK